MTYYFVHSGRYMYYFLLCTLGKIHVLLLRVYILARLSVFAFPPSWIWTFRVSCRFQFHKLQKLKWHPWSKDCVSHWMDKIIYEAVFKGEKRMFCSINASGAWCKKPMFCWLSSTNEHENITDRWMPVLYPASAVVSSVINACFICKLIKSLK